MVHRGPDDQGLCVDPHSGLSLSARRLSVIDLDRGHQPLHSEDGAVWAVLNGEIYNHASLRSQLERKGHRFASATDTEVLVHLYEEYGVELVHALEGMYAFAVWDRRRRELLLARDRFGEKPLFYTQLGDGHLAFASELTALRAGVGCALEIDPGSLDAFFVLGCVPGERTIFEGVRQLPPASILRWSMDVRERDVRSYWTMPRRPASRADSVSDLALEAGELLAASVRSRLAADVPVGVFLSGGLDSALVAALAAQQVSGRLRTFTVDYDTGAVGEARRARATAEQIGSDHSEVILSSGEISERVGMVMRALDQPNADPALIALHAVAQEARRTVTVAVGGEGADELFGGYPRYRWMRRADRAARLLPSGLAAAGAQVIASAVPGRAGKLAEVIRPLSLAQRQLEWVTGGRRQAREELYGPRMQHTLARDLVLEDVEGVLSACGRDGPVDALMALDRARYLPDDVLAKADRATMLVSLEMRTPYLSRELAELTAAIPTATHLRGGGKALLRQVARSLPALSGADRAKRAFAVPMAQWLRGPLLGALQEAADGPLVSDGWIDGAALRRRMQAHAMGSSDQSAILWPLLVMGLWMGAL